jgi:hypothetical protein
MPHRPLTITSTLENTTIPHRPFTIASTPANQTRPHRLVTLTCLALLSCGAATNAGTDAGTGDLFAGTWKLSGPIAAGNFVFPLQVVAASDGNYQGRYAGCVIPLVKLTPTELTGAAASCTVTGPQLQDSTYGGSPPPLSESLTLAFEAGTNVSVVADVMSATGAFSAMSSRVTFTLSGTRQ